MNISRGQITRAFVALAALACAVFVFTARATSQDASAPPKPKLVLTWKPTVPGCDDKFLDGIENKSQSTTQAFVIINLFPDLGKLAVHIFVENPEKSKVRLEVIPEDVHVFKLSNKGIVELQRTNATKIAKSLERRQRVAAGLSGFSAGMNQTTATATSSDGTKTTVTIPNTQAQTDAINRAHENISEAQTTGYKAIAEELKRNTLEPGQTAMGRLFFPSQKSGEDLLIQIDLGAVRYEFPFRLPKK